MKQTVEATLAQARRMNAPRAIALCQCFSGALEFQAGHWSEAEATLAEAIKLYQELGAASGEAIAWQRLGVLQTARGQLSEAMRSYEEGIAAAERASMRAHCMARLYASMTRNRLVAKDLEGAYQYLSLGLEMSNRHGNCATCDALLLPAAVSLHIAQGQYHQAEQYCAQLESAAKQYGSGIWIAMARQSRGEILVAQNQLNEALVSYREAYNAYRVSGYDYEAARCLWAMANLHSVRKFPQDEKYEAEIRKQAHDLFERLGVDQPARVS